LDKSVAEYKESRYAMWAHMLVKAMAAQRDFHEHSASLLATKGIVSLGDQAPQQPNLDFQKVTAQLPGENSSSENFYFRWSSLHVQLLAPRQQMSDLGVHL
jgi:hypothetical protein